MILPQQEEVAGKVKRVFDAYTQSEGTIRPHFIMTGASGTGKSYLIQQLADEAELGFMQINAAGLTAEGVSGNSLSKALSGLRSLNRSNGAVIFVDEFDKLFVDGNSGSAHESRASVQNEFLTLLESETTQVFGDYGKYIDVKTDDLLFVFAGAFNGQENLDHDQLMKLGLRTEFLGRVPLVFETLPVDLATLHLLAEQSQLLKLYNTIYRRKGALTDIKKLLTAGHKQNSIGLRRVNQVIHSYFLGA